ncbi:peptidyl-tRNA hydrolase 2, mitochondrial-like [Haliotis rufescens]|uniref:peptidyl-tRNA hydrolase 2, mitochondrial-like n=1 Tax=Haliotis rufescens TaxID=6454 RepID=UPI00201EE5B3|nr:peptidyl-tRNA hydrolase 2, mitochondrial-like [Haliotis rufescens]
MLSIDQKQTATFVLGLGIGIAVGWIFKARSARRIKFTSNNSDDLSRPLLASDSGEYKMVIVVRTDLKMGKGKIAAQCAHAAVAGAEKAFRNNQDHLYKWRSSGQPKVVVKTDDEPSLLALAKSAQSAGLTTSIIQDAGRTQIAPGSRTVLGVGPGPSELVDRVTGHLKLL